MSQNQGPSSDKPTQPTPPYPQPSEEYGQPGPQPYAYPTQQPPTQPYGYSTQQPPTQPYGYPAQQPYSQALAGSSPGYGPKPGESRSPVLGALSLGLVVVCGVVLGWAMWRLGDMVGPLAANGRVDQTQVQQALLSDLGAGWAVLLNGSLLLGLAAFVMGIVAVATKRGRGFAVLAIVLGVLAPFAAMGALVAALAPYIAT